MFKHSKSTKSGIAQFGRKVQLSKGIGTVCWDGRLLHFQHVVNESMNNLESLFRWMRLLRPDVDDMLILTDNCCHLRSFWVKIFGNGVRVKKDPAHLNHHLFETFSKTFADQRFLQMIKND